MSIIGKLQAIKNKPHKRLGRGYGSGKGGHNVGRGTKGAGSRKSGNLPIYFEGGQLPLTKRLPMIRGKARFQSFAKVAEVNLGDLDKLTTTTITLETLKLAGLADKRVRAAKIIATGKVNKALEISGLRLSAKAKELILEAGGKVN